MAKKKRVVPKRKTISPQKRRANAIKRIGNYLEDSDQYEKSDAKQFYKIIGKKNPTIKDVKGVIREFKAKEKAKLNAEYIIDQALEEIRNPRGSSGDLDEPHLLVKITIRGRNYTKRITGQIIDPSSRDSLIKAKSKVRTWKWVTSRKQRG